VESKVYLSTREVAELLDVNEKVVYGLIREKGLPGTKITGKWLFPRHMVEQWVEKSVVNAAAGDHVIVLAGSNDILLEKTLALFNRANRDLLAVFANVGSAAGIDALGAGYCHAAVSHLLQDDDEYNFDFAAERFGTALPAVVNFCRREQGFAVAPGNPGDIHGASDLGRESIRIANRPEGTGTRLLLDRELEKAGIAPGAVSGYDREFRSHLDAALEVFAGRADAAPVIRAAADLLGLGFVPLRWERFDLLIAKEVFFEEKIQRFLGFLHDPPFKELAEGLQGYDMRDSGKAVFPRTKGRKREGEKTRD